MQTERVRIVAQSGYDFDFSHDRSIAQTGGGGRITVLDAFSAFSCAY